MSQAKGIDISHWQGDKIDFPACKADGYDWVICRASHGMRLDETFQPNIQKARAENFVVGAYHYLYVDQGLQTQHLRNQSLAVGGVDFPLFLDVERYSNESATVAQWRDCINKNVKYLEDEGYEVGFYTSYWMWSSLTGNMDTINGKPAENYMMWVAHWSEVTTPSLPIPWQDWELWQQGSDLTPPWNGAGRTDYGVANMTPMALREKYLDQPEPDGHSAIWGAIRKLEGKFEYIKKGI